ncbi:MAG: hypothetical protein IT548_00115 [Alphaproteobacteria bacterium]|nr:hypothetical protein [Alphaproteobacteria bacterium]
MLTVPRLGALALGIALAMPAAAGDIPGAATAQRRTISPIALQGNWLGTPGRMPTDCAADGFYIGFGTNDGKTFNMSVRQRTGGVMPLNSKDTLMNVVPPPPNTPIRIDVFLAGQGSEIGVAIRTGSAMELIPAGADKSYAATSLYLMRCA